MTYFATLDLAVTPSEALEIAQQAKVAKFEFTEHGPGGGNPCIVLYDCDKENLLAVVKDIYQDDEDYDFLIGEVA